MDMVKAVGMAGVHSFVEWFGRLTKWQEGCS